MAYFAVLYITIATVFKKIIGITGKKKFCNRSRKINIIECLEAFNPARKIPPKLFQHSLANIRHVAFHA